jgi:hypothetical protein
MARTTGEDYATLLTTIKNDFDERLAQLAAQPRQWLEFIDHVAVFGAQYSLGNQILLLVQAEKRGITPRYFLPYGSKDGTTGWKAHQRHVRAGETAFKIWAPVKRRPTEQQAQERAAAGEPVKRDPQGRPAVQITGFRLTSTFELSQTDGEPFTPPTLPQRRRLLTAGGQHPQLLTGADPTGAYDDLVALITAEGYTYELCPPGSPHLRHANGVTITHDNLRLVKVRDDIDPAQRVKTTAHELAHIRCGHTRDTPGETLHRGRAETEAESIAHIVCRALDLDSSGYSDAYVFGWADGDLDLIRDCAETVLRVAKSILHDLEPTTAEPASTDRPVA